MLYSRVSEAGGEEKKLRSVIEKEVDDEQREVKGEVVTSTSRSAA